jgi:hypothetical protein
VAFGSQCSTLEKRLLVPNTLLVNILSGLYVVYGVDDKVESGPKIVVEELFVF